MNDASHLVLWKRVTQALNTRGISGSSQRELAASAQAKLGTDLVARFLNQYYLERQYGGGAGELTDEQAEALVRELESLSSAQSAPALRSAPAAVVVPTQPQPPASSTPAPAPSKPAAPARWDTIEEAEAFGDDTVRSSALDAWRQYLLEWRIERERQKAAPAPAAAQAAGTETTAAAQPAADTVTRERALREEAALQHANDLRTQGNVRAAITALETLVSEQPNSAAGWFTLAWYFGREGNFRRSTRCYERGLALDPSHKTAWNNLGHDYRSVRNLKGSIRALQKALEIDPDYLTAWVNIGATYREQKRFLEAAKAFHQVVHRRDNDGAAWYWLGTSLAQAGQHGKAAAALQRAATFHPDNAVLWSMLGMCLQRLNHRKEAAEAFARAKALGLPAPILHRDVPWLAIVTLLSAIAADQLDNPFLAAGTIAIYCLLVLRLKLRRAQLFITAVFALPVFALPFAEVPYGTSIGFGALVVATALAAQIWKYRRR